MPSLIISSYEGVTKVAPFEPTPEMLAEAETFESMDEALQAIGEVLAPQGAEQTEPEGAMPTEGQPMAADAIPQDDEDMQAGYSAAKRGQ